MSPRVGSCGPGTAGSLRQFQPISLRRRTTQQGVRGKQPTLSQRGTSLLQPRPDAKSEARASGWRLPCVVGTPVISAAHRRSEPEETLARAPRSSTNTWSPASFREAAVFPPPRAPAPCSWQERKVLQREALCKPSPHQTPVQPLPRGTAWYRFSLGQGQGLPLRQEQLTHQQGPAPYLFPLSISLLLPLHLAQSLTSMLRKAQVTHLARCVRAGTSPAHIPFPQDRAAGSPRSLPLTRS